MYPDLCSWRRGAACKDSREAGAAIPVIVKPGSVAGDDDVVSLLGHIVLVQVRVLGLLPLVPGTVFILILQARRPLDTGTPSLTTASAPTPIECGYGSWPGYRPPESRRGPSFE